MSYDTSNNLTKITDASGNIKNLTYDLLGHKLTEEDFHAPADATFSHWTYVYDLNGNLTSSTDAKSQTANYTYDELDRLLTEDFAGQAGTEVTYAYDTAPNGKGRLVSITTLANSAPVITKAFEYDLLGHVTKETRTINGTPYITQTEYDLAGNPKRIIYPDAAHTEELSLYNNAGQLEKVQKKQGTTTIDLVTNFDYAETGAPKVITYANGVTTTNTYDITYLYYLTHKVTAKGTTKLQDISYSFDPTGNISQITDASQTDAAKTVAYTYDGLSRLLTATATNAANGQNYAQTFSYDILGNITNKSDVGAYTYAQTNYASPQAVTAVGGKIYSYDNNGNLIGDGTWTHAWDYKDRLLSSGKTGINVVYSYDEGGTRVTKKNTTSGKTTTYVNDLLDIEAGTEKLSFYAGNLKLATLENTPTPTLSYNHLDHLSGASVDTDTSGNVLQLTDYYPYGDSRIESTTTAFHDDYTYTGKERDEDTNLLYYEARYYDSNIGRFISLDPWGGNIKDPQSLNKYAYVRNNPLRYTDPDGRVTVLITGFRADPNSMVALQSQISSIAESAGVGKIDVGIFKHNEQDDTVAFIKKSLANNPNQPVIIAGHSFGGDSAIEVANTLKNDKIHVDMLFQIDSVGLGDARKPSNVKMGVNFYQTDDVVLQGEPNVRGSKNIWIANTSHTTIDDNLDVQNIIANSTVLAHMNYNQCGKNQQSLLFSIDQSLLAIRKSAARFAIKKPTKTAVHKK